MDGRGTDRNYLAIIGDIRSSRELPNRAEVQKKMEDGLARINEEFRGRLAARFTITLGDEFQGLLERPEDAIAVLSELDSAFSRDVPLRYGLGWGTVVTEMRESAVGMDGPCFHNAREAVERGKREDRWATAAGLGDDDRTINALLRLVGDIRSKWTEVQRETVEHARRARTQREVAAARGVNESAVSQALKAALHESLLEAESAAAELLRRHGDKEER
jgi:hypothetical protein